MSVPYQKDAALGDHFRSLESFEGLSLKLSGVLEGLYKHVQMALGPHLGSGYKRIQRWGFYVEHSKVDERFQTPQTGFIQDFCSLELIWNVKLGSTRVSREWTSGYVAQEWGLRHVAALCTLRLNNWLCGALPKLGTRWH